MLYCFNRLGDVDDINQSVLKLQEAVRLTPDGYPDKRSLFNNLGTSLLARFERLQNLDNVRETLSEYSSAACASSGSSSTRFNASKRWALCHRILQNPPLVILEAYRVAIDLLFQLAWLGSPVPERHRQLKTLINAYAPNAGLKKYWCFNIREEIGAYEETVEEGILFWKEKTTVQHLETYKDIGDLGDVEKMNMIRDMTERYMTWQDPLISECATATQKSFGGTMKS